ncbi:MAG: hypothetical protein IT508_12705, partial [Burkholderiaceae bacterium]|nr:hypothetical protein [Burkholderiaceae bacterium]
MRRIARISPVAWMVAAALVSTAGAVHAQQAAPQPSQPQATPQAVQQAQQARDRVMTQEEMRLQAGASPLGQVEMHQNLTPKAPPMTKAEFDQARQIYFERCAGCHG